MTRFETISSFFVGALLIGVVVYSFRRIGTQRFCRTGIVFSAVSFLIVIGLCAVSPKTLIALSHSYRYVLKKSVGFQTYRHPLLFDAWGYFLWSLVLVAFLVAIGFLLNAYLKRTGWTMIGSAQIVLYALSALFLSAFISTKLFVGLRLYGHLGWDTYSTTFMHTISAFVFVVTLSLAYHIAGPILAVVSVLAIADHSGLTFSGGIDFGFAFDALAMIGLDNLFWQLTILAASAIWGVHEIFQDPLKSIGAWFAD